VDRWSPVYPLPDGHGLPSGTSPLHSVIPTLLYVLALLAPAIGVVAADAWLRRRRS